MSNTIFKDDPNAPRPQLAHCYGSHRHRHEVIVQYSNGESERLFLELSQVKREELTGKLEALVNRGVLRSFTITGYWTHRCIDCVLQRIMTRAAQVAESQRCMVYELPAKSDVVM